MREPPIHPSVPLDQTATKKLNGKCIAVSLGRTDPSAIAIATPPPKEREIESLRRATSLLARCDERMPSPSRRRRKGGTAGVLFCVALMSPRGQDLDFSVGAKAKYYSCVRVAFPSSAAARPFTARLFFVNLIPRGNCWQLYDPWRLRARRRWQHFIHLCPPRKDFFYPLQIACVLVAYRQSRSLNPINRHIFVCIKEG